MVIKSNGYILREIEKALLNRELQVLDSLCQEAIEYFLEISDWDSLVNALILYGKALRVKSSYSGNKSLIDKSFDHFEIGNQYLEKVKNQDIKTDLSLELAITYIQNSQYEKAETILEGINCIKSINKRLKIKCLNTKCLLKSNLFKFDEAMQFALEALSFADKLGEKESLNNSYRSVGMVYSRQHNFSKIPETFNEVLRLSNEIGDVEGKMVSYNNLAVYNASVSNYKTALENFLESYNLSESIGFKPHSARCLVNIGAIFSQLDNLELAEQHFEKVLEDYIEVLGVNTKAVILINLGEIYIKQNKLDAAANTIQLCLDFSLQENYKEFICLAYHHLGEIELKKGDTKKALTYSLKAKGLFEQFGDVSGREENLISLATCYLTENDLEKALNLAIEGVELSEKLENYNCIAKGSDLIAEVYSQLNQFEKAFQYQKKAQQNHKNVYEQKNSRAMLDLEIKYDMRNKEREIEMLKSTNKIQAQLLNKQTEFEQQNKLLLQANEELKQFTYAVSHDLREPVRMIESYIQILKNRYSDEWNDEQHEFFHYVSDGAVRMRLLLKDLLEYATLGGNALQDKTEFQLEAVVQSVELDLSLKIHESNTTILLTNDITLYTNRNLFRLVIQNLISNAIKFRKEDEDPIITVNAKEINDKAFITVEDNGIGIEEIYQDKVFRLFHRIHSKDKYKGTGIGLALCAKIVRMMEGEISITSQPGEGTTFSLKFQSTNILTNQHPIAAHNTNA